MQGFPLNVWGSGNLRELPGNTQHHVLVRAVCNRLKRSKKANCKWSILPITFLFCGSRAGRVALIFTSHSKRAPGLDKLIALSICHILCGFAHVGNEISVYLADANQICDQNAGLESKT